VRHPDDLPEGYHIALGGQAWQGGPVAIRLDFVEPDHGCRWRGMLPSDRDVIGLRQVDGMPHRIHV